MSRCRPARATGCSAATAASSRTAARASTARPAACVSTSRSTAWSARATTAATGSSPTTAGSSRSGTRTSTVRWADARLNQPVLGMERTASGKGYWLFASDGGIFSFGDAHFYGSLGGTKLSSPVVSMQRTATGKGYWMMTPTGTCTASATRASYGDISALQELRRRARGCSCRPTARATGSRPATAHPRVRRRQEPRLPGDRRRPDDRAARHEVIAPRRARSQCRGDITPTGSSEVTGLRGWPAHDAPCHRPLEPAPGNAGGGRDARDTRGDRARGRRPGRRGLLRRCSRRTRSSSRPTRGCIRPSPLGSARRLRRRRLSTPPIPPRSTRRAGRGAVVERHPADKDATDLELAFDAARDARARADHGRRRRGRPARPLPRQRARCSRRPASPTSRSTPGSATRTCVVVAGRRGRRTRSRATPGRS